MYGKYIDFITLKINLIISYLLINDEKNMEQLVPLIVKYLTMKSSYWLDTI